MADREKVIKGLDSCAKWMGENDDDACGNCPYHHSHFSYDDNNCIATVNNDAIAILKEQERRINELEEKLRLLEYGDQDILQSGMMPAT